MKLHTITAALTADKLLIFEQVPEINEGEHRTTVLEITVPGNLSGFNYFLEFLCPDDRKYISSCLEVVNNKIEYEIENCVLKGHGYVYAQLVARSSSDNKVVFKSVKDIQAAFWVNAGIGADIPVACRKDFLTKAQEIMANAAQAAEALKEKLMQLDADAASGRFDGKQGEKGDPGVVVSVPSGTVSFCITDGDLMMYY